MAKVLSLHAATLRRKARRLRRNSLFWDTTTREDIRRRACELERHAVSIEQEQTAAESDMGQTSRQES